jgi:LmbE family N-acetylglucosaminyl deacetylase
VVVSPHCDDAVLSLGAALTCHARRGGIVTVVTVLAGDPESRRAPGRWDVEAGFHSAGEAARVRRSEDIEACRILGLRAVHLDGEDEQYADHVPRRVADGLAAAIAGADEVLVPGAPLRNADHRRVREFALSLLPAGVARDYQEQPYASWARAGGIGWCRPEATGSDERRKARAVSAYRSQLRLLAAPFPVPLLGAGTVGLLGQLRISGEAVSCS